MSLRLSSIVLCLLAPLALADDLHNGSAAGEGFRVALAGQDLLLLARPDAHDDRLVLRTDGRFLFLRDETGLGFACELPGTARQGDELVVPLELFTGSILVHTLDGDDCLTVDLSSGDFRHPIDYHGGDQHRAPAGVGDVLAFVSSRALPGATYTFANESDGTVRFFGSPRVLYTGLEPITSTIDVSRIDLVYSTTGEEITITDATTAGQTMVDSTQGESLTFNNPSDTLTISAGDTGADTVTFSGLDSAWGAEILVEVGTGTDIVDFAGTIDLGSGNLVASAESVFVNADVTTTGAVRLTREQGSLSLGAEIAAGVITLDVPNGAIVDAGPGTLLSGVALRLIAGTGIGNAATFGEAINVAVDSLAAQTVTGDIHLIDIESLVIGSVEGLDSTSITTGGAGDEIILVEGDGGGNDDFVIDVLVSNNGPGNITLASYGGSSNDLTITADIRASGGNIVLIAEDDIDFNSTTTTSTTGTGTLEILAGFSYTLGGGAPSSSGQDATIRGGATPTVQRTGGGTITLNASQNIELEELDAGDGLVILTAGEEVSDAANGTNVVADSLVIRADGAIGDSDPIDTAVSFLAISNSGSGASCEIENTGALTITTVDGLDGIDVDGNVFINTTGALMVAANVTAALTLELSSEDSAAAGEDLRVLSGVTVSADDITLESGDDLILESGSSVQGSTVALIGDAFDADSGTGALIDLLGNLEGEISVSGDADADTITVMPTDADDTITIDGGDGDDAYAVFVEVLEDEEPSVDLADVPSQGNDRLTVYGKTSFDGFQISESGMFDGSEWSIDYTANLEAITVFGLGHGDNFDIAPSQTATITVFGGAPSTAPGDDLFSFDVPAGQTSTFTPDGFDGGTFTTTGGYLDVVVDEIESINDYGDAPSSYGTLASDNGPRHFGDGSLRLGSAFDVEPFGLPSAAADGDDNSDTDDEDGADFSNDTLLAGSGSFGRVDVTGSGLLDVWVDFNRNGTFDPNEKIFSSLSVGPGLDSASFNIPLGLTPGDSFARFRLSSAGGLTPLGLAQDGEVEDIPIVLDVDADGDGLGSIEEGMLGTSDMNKDTDGDGIEDGVEVALGEDPTMAGTYVDNDNDGLPQPFDPDDNDPDSNDDGISDGFAVALAGGLAGINGPFTFGDINRDGVIDSADVSLLFVSFLRGQLGNIAPYDADVNRDGMVDRVDVMILTQLVRGFRPTIPLQ